MPDVHILWPTSTLNHWASYNKSDSNVRFPAHYCWHHLYLFVTASSSTVFSYQFMIYETKEYQVPAAIFCRQVEYIAAILRQHSHSFFGTSQFRNKFNSHNRPSTYQLQRSATEHSSTRKSHSHKLQQAQYLSVTEEGYWALFCLILYKILHNLLNVLVQNVSKMTLQKA
jgi:hypothetical protein